ncbi:hypothetical protein ACGFNU_49375 [Spirillospora sp. NPDC048911]|uniref:hypothetical protein n=1 Tax=Spirillospora sp. NPDC048911 TaxID=3364527 RepID=UPI0037118FA3
MNRLTAAFALLLATIVVHAPTATATARPAATSATAGAADRACERLASASLPDATVTIAEQVPAGRYTAPDGRVLPSVPAFCRVHGVARPVPDSKIGFEVWMPSQRREQLRADRPGGQAAAPDERGRRAVPGQGDRSRGCSWRPA